MTKEAAITFPLRLYNEELIYVTYLSRVNKKPKSTIVREIIRQHKRYGELDILKQKEMRASTDDGKYEIIVRRKTAEPL